VTVLLDCTLDRTLAVLEAEPCCGSAPVWLFETGAARRAAEARLLARGVRTTIRSAYKPLLHAFLEEIDLEGIASVEIGYPVVTGVPVLRFLLECYPIDALIGTRTCTFRALAERELPPDGVTGPDGAPALHYEIVLGGGQGASRALSVPVPVRWCDGAAGRPVLRSCGWQGGALATDLETAFDRVLETVGSHPWSQATDGPLFDRLTVEIAGPFEDVPLALDGEVLSLAEAMHEELTFALLERFARLSRLPSGARRCGPGQIVPSMRPIDGAAWRLTIGMDPCGSLPVPVEPSCTTARPGDAVEPGELVDADRCLPADRMMAHLQALGGQAYSTVSCRGRSVHGRYVVARSGGAGTGPQPAVMISAGQHANEPTGPVGVLRAAHELRARGRPAFAVTPLLNPDGYALYRRLCRLHPLHMHHAARYTARGEDLESGDASRERGTWLQARKLSGATLHVNCHGYPSHEWTRPFSGYLPHGFERWTLPMGFFLIVRHAPGWGERADRLVDACVAALNGFPALMAINAEQLARHARYVPDHGVQVRSGVPVFVSETRDPPVPLTLITEAPDETVIGERFRILQEAQRRVVIAAVDAHGHRSPREA